MFTINIQTPAPKESPGTRNTSGADTTNRLRTSGETLKSLVNWGEHLISLHTIMPKSKPQVEAENPDDNPQLPVRRKIAFSPQKRQQQAPSPAALAEKKELQRVLSQLNSEQLQLLAQKQANLRIYDSALGPVIEQRNRMRWNADQRSFDVWQLRREIEQILGRDR